MEEKREFIVNAVCLALILGGAFIFFKYFAAAFLPFFVGFLISALIAPLVNFLSSRFELKKKPTGILILLVFYATVGMLATLLTVRAIALLGEAMEELPRLYSSRVEPFLISAYERYYPRLSSFFRALGLGEASDDLGGLLESLRSSIGSAVSELSVKALGRLSSLAAGLSGKLVSLLFSLLSSFFFTADHDEIMRYLRGLLPKRAVKLLSGLYHRLFETLGRYFRSYAIIMLITFGELSLGLLLCGAKRPFLAAFGIALFDLLPILGTGGILIPWSLWRLISGDLSGGVRMLVLWGIVTIVRNLAEPRIVGRQVGLHPLAALISMYVGARLFGFFGLFGLPIGLAVIVSAKNAATLE